MIQQATQRRIKDVTALKRKKGRDEQDAYQIEGIRLLESAIEAEADILYVYATVSALEDSRLRNALKKCTAKVFSVSDREMAKMSDTSSPSGALAVVKMPDPTTLCIACMKHVLVLDGISDPGNVGTLIRTAAWFGVDAVVAGPGTADFFAPKTVRSTMGGLWSLVLEKVDFLPGFVATNVRAGVDVRVADMKGTAIDEWTAPEHSMIVIGSEAHGVSQDVRLAASGTVTIPGHGSTRSVESLNAAVAGGILMSHWN